MLAKPLIDALLDINKSLSLHVMCRFYNSLGGWVEADNSKAAPGKDVIEGKAGCTTDDVERLHFMYCVYVTVGSKNESNTTLLAISYDVELRSTTPMALIFVAGSLASRKTTIDPITVSELDDREKCLCEAPKVIEKRTPTLIASLGGKIRVNERPRITGKVCSFVPAYFTFDI